MTRWLWTHQHANPDPAAPLHVESAMLGETQRIRNQVAALDFQHAGLGTQMMAQASALAMPSEEDTGLIPTFRVFIFQVGGREYRWVISWGVRLAKTQKGRRPRGEFRFLVADAEEAADLVDELGVGRLFDQPLLVA